MSFKQAQHHAVDDMIKRNDIDSMFHVALKRNLEPDIAHKITLHMLAKNDAYEKEAASVNSLDFNKLNEIHRKHFGDTSESTDAYWYTLSNIYTAKKTHQETRDLIRKKHPTMARLMKESFDDAKKHVLDNPHLILQHPWASSTLHKHGFKIRVGGSLMGDSDVWSREHQGDKNYHTVSVYHDCMYYRNPKYMGPGTRIGNSKEQLQRFETMMTGRVDEAAFDDVKKQILSKPEQLAHHTWAIEPLKRRGFEYSHYLSVDTSIGSPTDVWTHDYHTVTIGSNHRWHHSIYKEYREYQGHATDLGPHLDSHGLEEMGIVKEAWMESESFKKAKEDLLNDPLKLVRKHNQWAVPVLLNHGFELESHSEHYDTWYKDGGMHVVNVNGKLWHHHDRERDISFDSPRLGGGSDTLYHHLKRVFSLKESEAFKKAKEGILLRGHKLARNQWANEHLTKLGYQFDAESTFHPDNTSERDIWHHPNNLNTDIHIGVHTFSVDHNDGWGVEVHAKGSFKRITKEVAAGEYTSVRKDVRYRNPYYEGWNKFDEVKTNLLNNPEQLVDHKWAYPILRKHGFEFDHDMTHHRNVEGDKREFYINDRHVVAIDSHGWHHTIDDVFQDHNGPARTLDKHLTRTVVNESEAFDKAKKDLLAGTKLAKYQDATSIMKKHGYTFDHEHSVRTRGSDVWRRSDHEVFIYRNEWTHWKGIGRHGKCVGSSFSDNKFRRLSNHMRNYHGHEALKESKFDDVKRKINMEPHLLALHKWAVPILNKHGFEYDREQSEDTMDFYHKDGHYVGVNKDAWLYYEGSPNWGYNQTGKPQKLGDHLKKIKKSTLK